MSGRISQRVIQQIRDRVNLPEIVGQQVKLKKRGANYTGLCPFHSDKDPSFSVSADKGFFYCFGCRETGDAFTYVMKSRGLSYVEAVEALAGDLGIELEYESGDGVDYRKAKERRTQLLDVNREANSYFRSTLAEPEGRVGLEYLSGRGVARQTASDFMIGFAPSGSGLYDRLVRKGIPLNLAEELGLIVEGRGTGRYRDRLGSRVIFPIISVADQIAGFSGRTTPGGPEPKYLNSPESEVFKKGELLFGLVQARQSLKKSDLCILVEGQLDVVALHQSGMSNVAAPLGTALTAHQAAMLRRFTRNVVLMFDGDDAGRKATWRAISVLMNEGLYGRVAALPSGEDPDTILNGAGPEALEALVERAKPFLEYAVESIVAGAGRDLHGRTVAAREGMEFASSIQNTIDRQVFMEQLATELGLAPEALRVHAVRPMRRRVEADTDGPKVEELPPDVPHRERRLLELVVMRPEMVRVVCQEEVFELLRCEEVKEFLRVLLDDFEESGQIDVMDAAARTDRAWLKDLCAKGSLAGQRVGEEAIERAVGEQIQRLREELVKKQLRALAMEVKKAESSGSTDEAFLLYGEQEKLERQLATLSGSLN